ncbi:MAG: thiamine phosphate synthase [Campylobacterales bacterium]|nr:thiamine phosphate synthase [Campylobacterales bacterium]
MISTRTKRESLNSPFFYSYCITDPQEFGSDPISLNHALEKAIHSKQIDFICFRDKESRNILSLAQTVLNIGKKFHIPTLINTHYDLALELGFDGVHLTSSQFEDIQTCKIHNLFTIISCHTTQEIQKAIDFGADGVTYSPIFYKENKGEPKGVKVLKKVVEQFQTENFKIFALGGIVSDDQVNLVKTTKVYGFASIRYFCS